MSHVDGPETEEITGRVLVVDDDRATRRLHQTLLEGRFLTETAASGDEALTASARLAPDLILLDVEMPGMNGYEACRQLRQVTAVPILFVTSHDSLDNQVQAYDAGGNDIVIKPVAKEILLRKVSLAIQQYRATTRLVEEKESLNRMAMGFLSSMGQNGILLSFMRSSLACRSHHALAEGLITALADLGVDGSVLLRHAMGPTALTSRGEPTPLELAILEKSSNMGRVFQFSRRLVVNYDRVSILVADMPDEKTDPERAGLLRDNIATLAETVEALCDTVDMRIESMGRAEQLQVALGGAVAAMETLRRRYADSLFRTEEELNRLVDDVEKSFSWLGTSHSQEKAIAGVMKNHVRAILAMLAEHGDVDSQFRAVLEALRGGESNELELF